MSSTQDEELLNYIVKQIVENPNEVSIRRTIDERGVLLELTVNPKDLGRVIGKQGSTANAIRTILQVLGAKNGAYYNLRIVDNGVKKSFPQDRY